MNGMSYQRGSFTLPVSEAKPRENCTHGWRDQKGRCMWCGDRGIPIVLADVSKMGRDERVGYMKDLNERLRAAELGGHIIPKPGHHVVARETFVVENVPEDCIVIEDNTFDAPPPMPERWLIAHDEIPDGGYEAVSHPVQPNPDGSFPGLPTAHDMGEALHTLDRLDDPNDPYTRGLLKWLGCDSEPSNSPAPDPIGPQEGV